METNGEVRGGGGEGGKTEVKNPRMQKIPTEPHEKRLQTMNKPNK